MQHVADPLHERTQGSQGGGYNDGLYSFPSQTQMGPVPWSEYGSQGVSMSGAESQGWQGSQGAAHALVTNTMGEHRNATWCSMLNAVLQHPR